MKYGKEIAIGIASGLFASWIKSLVEPPLQELGEKIWTPTPEQKLLYGADVNGHPENMPPAVLIAETKALVSKKPMTKSQRIASLKIVHYLFGAAIGVGYAIAAKKSKAVSTGEGIPAGIAVWTLTHGTTLPAMGMQGKVRQMPKAWHIWEFGSHIIFGGALEACRKILDHLPDCKAKKS